jgi:DnaJ homolog subfamily B member 4
MKVGRKLVDGQSGQPVQVQEVLTIDVKPGWKDGTKVTFAGKGNETQPGQPAGDLVFIIKEQHHTRFVRQGNDLVYTYKIRLRDALCGGSVNVQHLDGSQVPVSFDGPLHPGSVMTVRCVH